ncbi:M56 family metallopeptidase [Spiractinospora alimapuensis]|uniref:M56 family metallopeptidase n=1 Tax=Spiractinospora alimapuensis TaxID=2820884 RepID=UPI001F353CE8|nr:M56 family metallopeptidase [Spiractinospora alimapuensis]QVQ50766.1 M56 family metallopeptidase [Spiractinospora alimapuensis]
MTTIAATLLLAVALSVLGHHVVAGAGRRLGPRGALTLWTLSTAGWLLGWLAVAVAIVATTAGPSLKGIANACLNLIQGLHRTGTEGWAALTLICAVLLTLRLGWVAVRRILRETRWRRGHLRHLLAQGRRTTLRGHPVWLLDSTDRDAYCLPGTAFGITVSRGTLSALGAREVDAVLAHENAHLRGFHHLLVGWVRLLAAAFPWVPLLRAAEQHVPVLVEWCADDAAAREVGVEPLVHALGALATREPPERHTLAASGACTVQRVRRLLSPPPRPRPRRRLITGVAVIAVIAAPMVSVALGTASMMSATCLCMV